MFSQANTADIELSLEMCRTQRLAMQEQLRVAQDAAARVTAASPPFPASPMPLVASAPDQQGAASGVRLSPYPPAPTRTDPRDATVELSCEGRHIWTWLSQMLDAAGATAQSQPMVRSAVMAVLQELDDTRAQLERCVCGGGAGSVDRKARPPPAAASLAGDAASVRTLPAGVDLDHHVSPPRAAPRTAVAELNAGAAPATDVGEVALTYIAAKRVELEKTRARLDENEVRNNELTDAMNGWSRKMHEHPGGAAQPPPQLQRTGSTRTDAPSQSALASRKHSMETTSRRVSGLGVPMGSASVAASAATAAGGNGGGGGSGSEPPPVDSSKAAQRELLRQMQQQLRDLQEQKRREDEKKRQRKLDARQQQQRGSLSHDESSAEPAVNITVVRNGGGGGGGGGSAAGRGSSQDTKSFWTSGHRASLRSAPAAATHRGDSPSRVSRSNSMASSKRSRILINEDGGTG